MHDSELETSHGNTEYTARLRKCPQCKTLHELQRFCGDDCRQTWLSDIRSDRKAAGLSDDRLIVCGGCGRVAMPAIPGRRACVRCEQRGVR